MRRSEDRASDADDLYGLLLLLIRRAADVAQKTRTEPRTALPRRRIVRAPAICRGRAAGRSSPHSAGVGRQPIRMIGLNGSTPGR
jgi:hypothetical protein